VSQPRNDGQDDLLGPSLDKIINLRHPLVRLAAEIDWEFLAGRFGSVCRVGAGQPALPTRLVAGLLILKHICPSAKTKTFDAHQPRAIKLYPPDDARCAGISG
jgi:hypothetical protein